MPELELPNSQELEEMRNKGFTRRVALATAAIAVVLAIASLGGNNATKEMLLAQQQASDQWAYYQSKVIREHLYRTQKLRLESEILDRGSAMRSETRKHYESLLRKMEEEEARYGGEKREIEQEAKKLDQERDINRLKDPYFDYAEVMLQIAIVMSSIAILSLSRPVLYFALSVAFLGVLLTANGYLLIIKIPFLH